MIRGDAVDARTMAAIRTDLFVRRAEWQGALPLAAAALGARADAGDELRAAAAARARLYADLEAARGPELRALLAALAARSVRALLMKGAQLAYTDYDRPDLRPRADTDVLVAVDDRERAFEVLQALGYQASRQVDGALVMYQVTYVKERAGQVVHVVDVHWRIANPQIFADLLSFDELRAGAVAVPALGEGAAGLSGVHALLVACVHRVAHHHDADRLIWLYDIHLLSRRLSPDEWRTFTTLCDERGVAQVCRWSLVRTVEAFGTPVPGDILRGAAGANERAELRTAAFLDPGRRHVEQVVGDLRALRSWRDRARLVGQHLFPSAVYMRSRYAPASSAPLAFLYVRRAMHGAWKWLAKP